MSCTLAIGSGESILTTVEDWILRCLLTHGGCSWGRCRAMMILVICHELLVDSRKRVAGEWRTMAFGFMARDVFVIGDVFTMEWWIRAEMKGSRRHGG